MNYKGDSVRITFLWTLVLISGIFPGIAAALMPQTPDNFQSVYESTRHSVVTILTYETGGGSPSGMGSGFYISPDVVVTNAHVVDGAGYVEVKKNLKDRPIRVLEILAVDRDADVALLRTSEPGVPLVLSDFLPGAGEPVVVISSPLGLEKTVSQGIISGFREHNKKRYLQITAPISPGSSGGPVLDRQGRVLGVTAFILDGNHAQNLNFAIPAREIQRVLGAQGAASSKTLQIHERDGEIVITD
jgi:S1-C subfamily serine protease